MKKSIFLSPASCAVALALFIGCNGKKVSKNNVADLTCESLTTERIELDSLLGIEELVGVKDGNLICKSSNSGFFFYVLNSNNYSIKAKFGVKGNAGNEWIAPHLLLSNEKNICYVLDNGTRNIYKLYNFQIKEHSRFNINGIANNPKVFANYFCFSDEHPNKIVFRLNSFKDNMPIDSVVIEDSQKEGKAFLNNFAYDLNNDNAVLAYQYKDKFEVYKILSNNKLDLICSVQGNELVNENEIMYFSDATIVGNRIYLLSQRHVDLAQEKGYSSVEVYDLAGKALKNYKLNFIASQMRIDKSNETIYLLSATDGMLEKIRVPQSASF